MKHKELCMEVKGAEYHWNISHDIKAGKEDIRLGHQIRNETWIIELQHNALVRTSDVFIDAHANVHPWMQYRQLQPQWERVWAHPLFQCKRRPFARTVARRAVMFLLDRSTVVRRPETPLVIDRSMIRAAAKPPLPNCRAAQVLTAMLFERILLKHYAPVRPETKLQSTRVASFQPKLSWMRHR